MIQRASFKNFKALRDVEVTFDSRLTVLVGPNGSGKTSVLQGIHFLTELVRSQSIDSEFALANVAEFTSIGSSQTRTELSLVGVKSTLGEYSINIESQPKSSYGTLTPRADKPHQAWLVSSEFQNGRWHVRGFDDFGRAGVTSQFDLSAFVRFSASQLAAPSLTRTTPPQIAKDGTGLATTLKHIKSHYPERFQQIVEAFRRVIRGVESVEFESGLVPDVGFYGDSIVITYQHVKGVKAAHVSSGTLFALGLLTVLLGPDSPNIILLDDLDHGLHPKAQMELIEVFRSLVEEQPELQIIATSHSPYILDRLKWEEVRVTSLQDDGSATCVPLTAHPNVEKWRDAMTPGEFWSHLGDDWIQKLNQKEPAQVAP